LARKKISILEADCLQNGLHIFKVYLPKYKPHEEFEKIKPLKKRAVFILHRCGFSLTKIAHFFNISRRTAYYWVAEGYDKYPALKDDKFCTLFSIMERYV